MSSTLASLPRFSPITFNSANDSSGLMLPEVAKTGLGSSAAMTSAVVGALLHYLQIVRLPCSDEKFSHDSGKEDLDLVHAISQAAHSLAQGKIGSGFDVSAAVFGSQRYVRFSPTLLSAVQVIQLILSKDGLLTCELTFNLKNCIH
jgi:phosphomevalonate kinase